MQGFNVLHPMGWDAFGLPAEQYAIKNNTHPRVTTEQNVANFRRQIQMLGLSYDWDREVDTTDPGYYKWTQWIFLQLFNSYFDPIDQKAKPVAHLEQELFNENLLVAPDGEIVLNRVQEGMEAIVGANCASSAPGGSSPARRNSAMSSTASAWPTWMRWR